MSNLLGLFPPFDLSRSRRTSGTVAELRVSLVALAQHAEKCERFDDLCRIMKEIIKLTADQPDLSRLERQLLWVGYKSVFGNLRSALRSLKSGIADTQHQQQLALANGESFPEPFFPLVDDYQQHLEKEIHQNCSEIIQLIESVLIKNSQSPDNSVFYMKLAADFYRYLSEIASNRPAATSSPNAAMWDKKASDHYFNGLKLAQTHMQPNNPVRLAISLNYSVHLYENLKDRRSAAELAKAAFDGSILKLDELEPTEYKDATLVMQLLRDNLTLWTSQEQQMIQQQAQMQR